jgi:hypothetical protein
MKKSKQSDAVELESELLRLNTLVRERRKQLARLAVCPNKTCECRKVWSEVVEEKLAGQMGKIRKQVRARPRPARNGKAK